LKRQAGKLRPKSGLIKPILRDCALLTQPGAKIIPGWTPAGGFFEIRFQIGAFSARH